MSAKAVERYRLRLSDVPATRAAARVDRHAAITRELGTFAKYQDWAEKLKDNWKAPAK
ncbi:MAG: hypothetical protein O9284_05005 [Steroidobacteraceae bacterium]|jgi:hypothetical protein|nr:hypothetical protein [Steroidobacteraceae bacterium]